MSYDAAQLSQLVAEIRRPHLGTGTVSAPGAPIRIGRDAQWDEWRDIIHRRKLPWLPEKTKAAFGHNLYYRDSRPGRAHAEVTQRLGVNAVSVSVTVRGDAGPVMGRRGEKYETWLRGVMAELDPLGLADQRAREYQSCPGVGCLELEFMSGYTPPERGGMSDSDYDMARDAAARGCGLPVRLIAPDPRSLYWPAGQETPSIIVKVVNKPLIDVANKWTSEGFRLAFETSDDGGRIVKNDYILGGEMAPDAANSVNAIEVGKYVRCYRVADGEYIYDLVHPQSLAGPTAQLADDTQGGQLNLMLLAKYRNPLGHPPFYLCPARTTGDPDPAYHYKPLILETIEIADEVNGAASLRKIAGYREALKPNHARPRIPAMSENGTPDKVNPPGNAEALITPGVLEYDGDFLDIPTPSMQHLEKWWDDLRRESDRADSSIRAALKAGEMGRTTPAWAMLQYKEEDNGFLGEAVTSRANAYTAILKDVTAICKARAKEAPIYVSASGHDKKKPEAGNVDMQVGMTAQDFDGPFRVSVTIDVQTQSQRAAETEYWRRLGPKEVGGDGTLSQETYEDNIGIQDRLTEKARKQREAMERQGDPFAMNIAMEMAKAELRSVFGQIADIVLGPPTPFNVPAAPPPTEGAAPMQGAPPPVQDETIPQMPDAAPVMPGLGMDEQMPDAFAQAAASTNGAFPIPG